MAKSDEDLELLFDADPFIASIEKMKVAFDNFVEAMQKKDETTQGKIIKTSQNSSKQILSAFKKLAVIGGIFLGVFGILKKTWQKIPELGMAFKFAGDIFWRNFLWPMRRLLIPMLNNFLRWVRNSRAMFVQWGSVLANIFMTIKTLISTAINLIKNLLKGFLEGAEIGIGGFLKRTTQMINLTLFKITMLLAFLSIKLQPIMKIIGGIFGTLVKQIKEFSKGFIEGLAGITKNIDLLGKLENIFEGILNIIEKLTPLFEPMGKAIGALIGGTLMIALDTIETIISGISTIIDLLSGQIKLEDVAKKTQGWFDKHKMLKALLLPGGWEELDKEERRKQIKHDYKVDDAIIRPDGQVIKTNPLDTIFAVKNPENMASRGNAKIDINNIFHVYTTEGDAKNTGENFGEGVMNAITFELNKMFVLKGNK